MDYKPRYPQPFTLTQAVLLDVSVITEEIARLQNSLNRLMQTKEGLREYLASESPEDADPEVAKALEENEVVIGSQEERISILKIALAEKGVHAGSHYDLKSDATSTQHGSAGTTTSTMPPLDEDSNEEDGGIHL